MNNHRFNLLDETYVIRFNYDRPTENFLMLKGEKLINGITYCRIFKEKDPLISATSYAECSMKDNFCRKIGRKLSFGRALKLLIPNNRELRGEIWNEYFKLFPRDR